jgi:hypothetical protein
MSPAAGDDTHIGFARKRGDHFLAQVYIGLSQGSAAFAGLSAPLCYISAETSYRSVETRARISLPGRPSFQRAERPLSFPATLPYNLLYADNLPMNDLLFHRHNIFDIIESRKLDLKEEIKRIPAEAFNDDIHALV